MQGEQLNPLPQIRNVNQANTCFAEVYVSLQLHPPHAMVACLLCLYLIPFLSPLTTIGG